MSNHPRLIPPQVRNFAGRNECAGLSALIGLRFDRPRSASEEQESGFVAHDGNVSFARCDVFQEDHVTGM